MLHSPDLTIDLLGSSSFGEYFSFHIIDSKFIKKVLQFLYSFLKKNLLVCKIVNYILNYTKVLEMNDTNYTAN